jgi:hypothetical protein
MIDMQASLKRDMSNVIDTRPPCKHRDPHQGEKCSFPKPFAVTSASEPVKTIP